MSLRDNELARRVEGKVELRPAPLRVRWTFDDISASDGHALQVTFTCSAKALPDSIERKMFEEVLLGSRYALTAEDLATHFQSPLRTAVAKAGAKHPASEWADGQHQDELIESLRLAAAPVAFGCGVEVLWPFQVDVQSPSFERQRQRSMQQALAEQQTAGQLEHVHRAGELLKQFQSIREATPDLSPGRVLQQISPSDRGAVLQTLLLASARQHALDRLWAVAGPYLIRIDIQDGPPRPQLFPLPPSLGPLRSISAAQIEGKRQLLVGARSGFMLIDPQTPHEARLFSDRGIESPLGFNHVLYWNDKNGFAASHGDAGIVRWDPNESDAPKAMLRPGAFLADEPMITSDSGSTHTAGPRNLQVLDEQWMIFSAANKLFATNLQITQPISGVSNAEIVSILRDDGRLIVIHDDGTIAGMDSATREVTCICRRGSRVRSAGSLPWLGTNRLLLSGDDGPIQCIGLDDPLVSEYQSAHRGFRVVAGSAEWVAAVSADRQRLILWQSWDGRRPLTEVYLTGLTRHRVADIAFG